jgi:intein/homing endonuclease
MADNKSIFDRLKTLFSTNVVVRNVGGKRLKVVDTARYQADGNPHTSKVIDRYGRLHGSRGTPISVYNQYNSFSATKIDLYTDYEAMDTDAIICSALDIYSDESTLKNAHGDVLTIKTDNDNIRKILHNLFYDIINIEYNLWPWIRNLCKYGDHYLYLDVKDEVGITNAVPLSPYEMQRDEGTDPEHIYMTKFIYEGPLGKGEFQNYEIAHFRLIGDTNFLPYGKCLASNSYVDTEFGRKRIDEILVGERVWSFNKESNKFELTEVINVCNSGIKETLKISTLHNEIECSEDHPVLVKTNNGLEYKKAKDISMSDLLIISTNKQKTGSSIIKTNKNFITEHNKNGWRNDSNSLPDFFDEEFAKFFGFMIGDGWVSKDNKSVYFATGVLQSQNEYYANLLSKYSNKECIVTEATENSGGQIHVNSRMLSEFLVQNGFIGNARTKRVPNWVFESSDDIKLSFIRGMVDADGSIFTDKWNINRYSIELNNKKLVEDIKSLLGTMNIKCSNVSTRGFDGRTTIRGIDCNRVKSHYIYFYLDAEKKSGFKKYGNVSDDGHIYEPVKKIEYIGEQETFDIQVQSNNSNFIANGIVVHNSMLEGARKLYKQLVLMEDAMLIHRIMRAPEKRVFKVDIGNIPPAEVDQYMQNIIDKMKKVPVVNEQTGQYNLRYNMQNILEDFYLPVRGGQAGTSIETLPGLQYQAIEDVEYLKSKIFAALKIPKAYLGYDESLEGKATLATLDIRFARTIERIQRIVISELTKIAIVHLYAQGYENADLVNFELSLTGPSIVYEQEKIALMKEKVDLAGSLIEKKLLSMKTIYADIFNLSDDEAEMEKNNILEDIKHAFRQKQIESEGNDPMITKESFGTPHDLATMNIYGGKKIRPINDVEVPEGGWPGAGRPPEHGSTYGTDASNFGRDATGRKDIGKSLKVDLSPKHNYRGSAIRNENQDVNKQISDIVRTMGGFNIKTKSIISESLKPSNDVTSDTSNLLNENNLLEEM